MLRRSTPRRWFILVTVALAGCTLNPQGEDPGFEEGSGFENSAGDDIVDDLPGREGETSPSSPSSDPIDVESGDDVADDDAPQMPAGEPPPSEPPPVPMIPEPVVEPADDVEPAYGDAGAVFPVDAGAGDAGLPIDGGKSDAGRNAGPDEGKDGGPSPAVDAGTRDASPPVALP